MFQKDKKGKGESSRGWCYIQYKMELTIWKCFRCGSEDHMIAKCPKPPKDSENGGRKYVLIKKVIVHATTAKITATKRYMHIWHVCLAMTNLLVKTFVTVHNLPIGFYILEQRATLHQKFNISLQVY